MAGKRQHYIPQFLQRGFTIDSSEKAFVIRAGKPPYLSNIQNIGVEGYFYTEGDDVVVYDLITEEENAISLVVNNLRNYPNGKIVSSKLAAQLSAHFEIRTRHIRMNFFRGAKNLVEQISYALEDEKVFLAYLKKQIINDKSLVEEQVNLLDFISNDQKKLWIEIFQSNPDFIIQNLPKPILNCIAVQLRQQCSDENLIKKMKEGHLKALKQTIAPDEKIAIFSELTFKVVDTEDKLFLGDSIVVFVNSNGRWKPFYEKGDRLKSIIIPLNQNRYLLGSASDDVANIYSSEELREMLASCSLEFFYFIREGIE